MTNTKEQKRQLKRKGSEKRQTVSFDAEEEAASKATEEYDQDEVDKVLGDQKFPTQKISSKKKKVAKEAPPVEEKNEESESEDAEPPAITYLLAWKEDKKKWKFKKLRQTWLLQNMYNKNKVSKSNFKILLEYIEELKGAAREQTLKIAKDFVEKNEDAEECKEKRKLKRSLKILKVLS